MIERTYEPDPAYTAKLLCVGDEIWYLGTSSAKVTQINLTENSVLDGIPVPAIPWEAVSYCTVVLDNGHWAYGDQIKRKE